MSTVEGFETEIVLDEIPPKLNIFLSRKLSFLINRARPTIVNNMLITKELCWQLVDSFLKDTDINIFARGQDQVWTNFGSISVSKT